MDEFGFDDDALAGFDIDAAVAAATQAPAKVSLPSAPVAGGAHAKAGGAKVSPPTSPPEEDVDWGAEEEFLASVATGGAPQLSQHEQEIPDDFMSELGGGGGGGGGGGSRASGDGSAGGAGGALAAQPRPQMEQVQQAMRCAVAPTSEGAISDAQLLAALQQYYGHDEFRDGQLDAVRAACQGQDVCVFWATGQGKSLVYQLPALTTGRISLVVSPLISLMTDQVAALNHQIGGGKEISCFLGTSQMDGSMESRALSGQFSLIYITPEKLYSSFLDRLQPLIESGRIGMLAVDEAHCISEWGHDFRASYTQIGLFRAAYPNVPIVALTATAVPKVRVSIAQSLQLRSPFIASKTFDRTNLEIVVRRKIHGESMHNHLAPLIQQLSEAGPQGGCTIVYCVSRKDVESVGGYLSQNLRKVGVRVEQYHAGFSPQQRKDTHYSFLSGRTQVVVATVAFGMGIDKPDIRRVVHIGAPKTVEEYYQQIGRAGRDGLPARCEMICTESDFTRYKDDFYLGNLTPEKRKAMELSIDALRLFASEGSRCRRRMILEFFKESPPWERCQTCDNCVMAAKHQGDMERDFGAVSRLILKCLEFSRGYPFALSKMMQIIAGSFSGTKRRDSSETFIGRDEQSALDALLPMRQTFDQGLGPRMRRQELIRELLPALTQKGYITVKSQTSGFRAYDVYTLGPHGMSALNSRAPIMLPVPAAIRRIEAEQAEKAASRRKELEAAGVKLASIPKKQLDEGEGPIIKTELMWARTMEKATPERRAKLEALLAKIIEWRAAEAEQLRMAPATIIPDYRTKQIAYSQIQTVEGLKSLGLRSSSVTTLALAASKAIEELGLGNDQSAAGAAGGSGGGSSPVMLLPSGVFRPDGQWQFAQYKPGKTRKPWEVSWERFVDQGQHLESIALNQFDAKGNPKAPVKQETIAAHLLQAFGEFGKPLDLQKLQQQAAMPVLTQAEWERLDEVAAATEQDPVNQPKFAMKEILSGIDSELAAKEFKDRTEAESQACARWYGLMKWWAALKRAKVPVEFGQAVKKQRC